MIGGKDKNMTNEQYEERIKSLEADLEFKEAVGEAWLDMFNRQREFAQMYIEGLKEWEAKYEKLEKELKAAKKSRATYIGTDVPQEVKDAYRVIGMSVKDRGENAKKWLENHSEMWKCVGEEIATALGGADVVTTGRVMAALEVIKKWARLDIKEGKIDE